MQSLFQGLLALALVPNAFARFTPGVPPVTMLPPAPGMGMIPARAEVTTATMEALPVRTTDPGDCVAANVTKYFDVIKPSGDLAKAMGSYAAIAVDPCVATVAPENIEDCFITDPQYWCGLSTNLPPALTTSYSSYASSAADFWRANSKSISVLSTYCPKWWGRPDAAQHEALSLYIAHGGCYITAHPSAADPAPTNTGFSSLTISAIDPASVTVSPPSASASAATSGAGRLGLPLLFRALWLWE